MSTGLRSKTDSTVISMRGDCGTHNMKSTVQTVLTTPREWSVHPSRKTKVFTSRVFMHRLRLWVLCVWLFVLRGVMCWFAFVEAKPITHLRNDWGLFIHLSACVRVHSRGFSAADLLQVYQRRESTPPREGCSRSAMLRVLSHGSDEPLRTALIRVLCGGQLRLRDPPTDLWQATVRDVWVPQRETLRDFPALEVGHVATVQRIERLCLALTAQDEVALTDGKTKP